MNNFMQRFTANRNRTLPRMPNMPHANGDADSNGASTAVWPARNNGMPPPSDVMFPMGGHASHGIPGGSSMIMSQPELAAGSSGFLGGGMSVISFKCPECNIVKHSSDDLEIHIKTEHLNWLPFKCSWCAALRASDTQMYEHVHSHHRKDDTKYFYLHNPQAKRMLQTLMDRALVMASQLASSRPTNGNGINGTLLHGAGHPGAVKRPRVDNLLQRHVSSDGQIHGESMDTSVFGGQEQGHGVGATATVLPARNGTSSIDADLALIEANRARASATFTDAATNGLQSITEGPANVDGMDSADALFPDGMDQVDDETSAQLSAIFGSGSQLRSEFDVAADSSALLRQLEESFAGDPSGNEVLQNVASLFSAKDEDASPQSSRTVVRNRNVLTASKKRVLGECSRCHKPVTAGARQMHMFFHLGKDHNVGSPHFQ
ncbi:zinc finger protein [Aphelenchoides avenae]|nr:zinc finger protein [Aphelenchus avenae]